MNPQRLQYLLEQVQLRVATGAECDELIELIRADEKGEYISFITDYHWEYLSVKGIIHDPADIDWHTAAAEVLQVTRNIPEQAPVRSILYLRRWWVAAAVVLLVCAGGFFLFRSGNTNKPELVETIISPEINAGKSGAILTLADGRQVVLDSLGNGLIAQQSGAKAMMQNGKLVYDAQQSPPAEIVYNTMSTPKGRQFQVTLPDGTRVWLNAESSIRYPTVFSGKDRQVAITGEVYFEAMKNAGSPFIVKINKATNVEVLGTDFNVNAYTNEQTIDITLLNGKVKVNTAAEAAVLMPGKQAQVAATTIKVGDADIEKVIAWKNGLFDFRNVSFAAIMRQLERWYDIEVVYENKVPDLPLMGKISRDVSLQGLLKNLERMGVQCRLDGRKLIIH